MSQGGSSSGDFAAWCFAHRKVLRSCDFSRLLLLKQLIDQCMVEGNINTDSEPQRQPLQPCLVILRPPLWAIKDLENIKNRSQSLGCLILQDKTQRSRRDGLTLIVEMHWASRARIGIPQICSHQTTLPFLFVFPFMNDWLHVGLCHRVEPRYADSMRCSRVRKRRHA